MKKLLALTIICILSSLSTYASSFILEIGICKVEFNILPTFDRTVELKSVISYSYTNLTPPDKICLNVPETVEYNSYKYTVTSIAKFGLNNCPPTLSLPKTISSIGGLAFGNEITKLTISEENPYYCFIDGIIYDKAKTEVVACLRDVKSAFLPNTVKEVSDSAFYGCALEMIVLPDNVERLGVAAFRECKNLHEVNLPKSLLKIREACFQSSGLESIVIPGKINEIESHTFYNTHLKNIDIPEGVVNIGSHAFAQSELSSVILPNSLVVIGPSAFYETLITEIELPTKITVIENGTFCRSKLKTMHIPASICKIDYNAFSGCSDLETVIFDGEYCDFGYNVFSGCPSLNTVILPNKATDISDSMFEGCTALQEIKLPSSCNKIGYGAFSRCNSLSSIEFSSDLTSIGTEAFAYCDALSKVEFPKGLEKIWQNAFSESRIVELHLPESLSYIAKNAFSNCKVQSIYCCWENPPTFENIWCEWNYEYSSLYVPIGTDLKYKSTYPWHQFYKISEYDNSGINDVTAESPRTIIEMYDLQGRNVSSEYKGVMIIKYSDGTTTKYINN